MSETRRRQHVVQVRIDDEELAEIVERTQMSRLSRAEYFRRAAFSRRIDHAADLTGKALREFARANNNLNQLTRLNHLGQHNQKDVSKALAEVRNAAAKLSGSDPTR